MKNRTNKSAKQVQTCYKQTMDAYQKEQLDAILMVKAYIDRLLPDRQKALMELIAPYLDYRKKVDVFLENYFSDICTRSCYENNRSACCSKEGIITFFADTVINVLVSSDTEVAAICERLKTKNSGLKCIYLGASGCLWQIKPIVCVMFLCDSAKQAVFSKDRRLMETWEAFRQEEKMFKWPDQPVLFDDLEKIFIKAGYSSPLMYLHNSPGLLRVKQQSENYPK